MVQMQARQPLQKRFDYLILTPLYPCVRAAKRWLNGMCLKCYKAEAGVRGDARVGQGIFV